MPSPKENADKAIWSVILVETLSVKYATFFRAYIYPAGIERVRLNEQKKNVLRVSIDLSIAIHLLSYLARTNR